MSGFQSGFSRTTSTSHSANHRPSGVIRSYFNSRTALESESSYCAKLRAASNAKARCWQSLHVAPAVVAALGASCRPQQAQTGAVILRKLRRHSSQMGIVEALSSGWSHTRHGAGKSTEATASQARCKYIDTLPLRNGWVNYSKTIRKGSVTSG